MVPLLDVLEETRAFESTIPSDKLYAVLSLADKSLDVPVDYSASPEEVFTRLARQFLEGEKSSCTTEPFEAVYRWMTEEATGRDPGFREGRAYVKRMQKARNTFLGSHLKWCHNRHFIRTASDGFGLAVNGTEVGDVLAVFYGAEYPVILREQSNGEHRIIGDCYLDQLMDGEAIDSSYPEHAFSII